MLNHNILSILVALYLPCSAIAQNHGTADSRPPQPSRQPTPSVRPWQQLFEQLADYDDIETNNLEDLYDRLCELETSPINLNTATDDDIRQLAFLSSAQQEELTAYLDRCRPLHSLGELSMISSLDPIRLQLLRNFVVIGGDHDDASFPSLSSIAKYGKNELVAAARVPFYSRADDRNGYLGYKYKHWLRYRFNYGQYVRLGITGTQDAGEPFFAHGNGMGYDHYAYYLMVQRLGPVKALALGQYKLRMGLGLVMNTGFTLGKTSSLVMSAPSNNISPNSSRSEAYYLQGGAMTLALGKHLNLTTFFSYRKIDATLNDDGTIKTILKTGYHRTVNEMQRKHNASQLATGASIGWRSGGWHTALNGIMTSFNRELSPNTSQIFRRYSPAGKHFYNGSIDYGFINHRITANGETAINNDGAIATLNTISLKTSPSLTLTAIQRFYSYRYYSLFSSSFSDGGNIQNESGMYLGMAWVPMAQLSVLAYADYAYFPWARYTATGSSHSWDFLTQASYNLSQRLSLNARYRLRLKQENHTDDMANTVLTDKTEHRARLALAYSNSHWTLRTQADAAYIVFPGITDDNHSLGGMLTQTVGYQQGAISIAGSIGIFSTHDYDSRLYAYERSTLYTFSFPMFYGEGMRATLFARGNIGKQLILICKIGTTKYFDRDHISSAYQQINKSIQTDMDLQLKWKF